MPRLRLTAAATAALLPLSACAADSAPPPAQSMPPLPGVEPDCGAEKLGAYVGQRATDAVMAAIREWRAGHPVRVLRPGSVVTMDYRPDRLNVDLDANGVIKGFRCT
ncbi:I78 family peptidase inhibitor [Novosphingobium beihaiensis]|uniref:I78 family peptidase inhibitor n=1 Tax=Novosphingobium beihaiensis TaxID=2930389 RepID=A0ABT0BQW8_9SPHN|nr:I78 family peptidase inhibitor [Novosphingobium beihaiensis]MCJ2187373.1 I78 family peptidase inhibitor [Novosphingobium beihaiensis]